MSIAAGWNLGKFRYVCTYIHVTKINFNHLLASPPRHLITTHEPISYSIPYTSNSYRVSREFAGWRKNFLIMFSIILCGRGNCPRGCTTPRTKRLPSWFYEAPDSNVTPTCLQVGHGELVSSRIVKETRHALEDREPNREDPACMVGRNGRGPGRYPQERTEEVRALSRDSRRWQQQIRKFSPSARKCSNYLCRSVVPSRPQVCTSVAPRCRMSVYLRYNGAHPSPSVLGRAGYMYVHTYM